MLQIIDNDIGNLIERFGQPLKYYSGRLCSCVRENNGTPKIDCGCNLGFWYDAPEEITGIRTQISYKYLNTPQGRIYDGGASFTIPKYYEDVEQKAWIKLAHGDVIVVDNKIRRETDVLTRGTRDYLFAFDVVNVLVVSKEDKIYVKDADYTVAGNKIIWVGNAPAAGEKYAVEFTVKQQYKVWDAGAGDRGTGDDELPKRINCVLRRFVENDNVNPLDDFKYFSDDIYEGL